MEQSNKLFISDLVYGIAFMFSQLIWALVICAIIGCFTGTTVRENGQLYIGVPPFHLK